MSLNDCLFFALVVLVGVLIYRNVASQPSRRVELDDDRVIDDERTVTVASLRKRGGA